MLDIVYLALGLAIFALLGLYARWAANAATVARRPWSLSNNAVCAASNARKQASTGHDRGIANTSIRAATRPAIYARC